MFRYYPVVLRAQARVKRDGWRKPQLRARSRSICVSVPHISVLRVDLLYPEWLAGDPFDQPEDVQELDTRPTPNIVDSCRAFRALPAATVAATASATKVKSRV